MQVIVAEGTVATLAYGNDLQLAVGDILTLGTSPWTVVKYRLVRGSSLKYPAKSQVPLANRFKKVPHIFSSNFIFLEEKRNFEKL